MKPYMLLVESILLLPVYFIYLELIDFLCAIMSFYLMIYTLFQKHYVDHQVVIIKLSIFSLLSSYINNFNESSTVDSTLYVVCSVGQHYSLFLSC